MPGAARSKGQLPPRTGALHGVGLYAYEARSRTQWVAHDVGDHTIVISDVHRRSPFHIHASLEASFSRSELREAWTLKRLSATSRSLPSGLIPPICGNTFILDSSLCVSPLLDSLAARWSRL
jgi:hypothetical protein